MGSRTLILLLILITSCRKPDEKPIVKRYTDIKGFFESEALRLSRAEVLADKSVRQNEVSETKNGLKVDWQNELALFTGSDINKPAWRDSYRITKDSSTIIYLAIDTNLRTRSIRFKKNAEGRLILIQIHNRTKNQLYESSEDLTYIPDSIYLIDKSQKVLFLGKNRYQIRGKLMW